jgi:hypothetical protein
MGHVLLLWQALEMPAADTVLLPICVGLSLLGIIVTGIAWRRGNKGRLIQGIGLALVPIALYFTGLLRILWDLVVAVIGWAGQIIFSPAVWFGLCLLGVCIVLWVVGGIVARRAAVKAIAAGSSAGPTRAGSSKAVGRTSSKSSGAVARQSAPPMDDDMAEIEALLKKRGIE